MKKIIITVVDSETNVQTQAETTDIQIEAVSKALGDVSPLTILYAECCKMLDEQIILHKINNKEDEQSKK